MILSTIVLFLGANSRESYLGVGYIYIREKSCDIIYYVNPHNLLLTFAFFRDAFSVVQ